MLQSIFNILNVVSGDTENIKIAQGKYYLPSSLKETYNKIKTEIKWHSKRQ